MTDSRRSLVAAVCIGLASVGIACGGGDTSDATTSTSGPSAPPGTPPGSVAPGVAVEIRAVDSPYGPVLVDGGGRTLYVLTDDQAGRPSACAGACPETWPAVLAEDPVAGEGVDPRSLGTASTDVGLPQATVAGRRLYTYVGDAGPGHSNGNGIDDIWFVVAPDGSPRDAKA